VQCHQEAKTPSSTHLVCTWQSAAVTIAHMLHSCMLVANSNYVLIFLSMLLCCCCHCLLYHSAASAAVAACCLFFTIAAGWLLLCFIDFFVSSCYRHTLANAAASTALAAATFVRCHAILLMPLLPLLSMPLSSVDCLLFKINY